MTATTLTTKAASTRERIIDSAAGAFWRRSYHGVSMDELADLASVNKATIYRYFSDKAALALAVTEKNGAQTLSLIFEPSFETDLAPDERLETIYRCVHKSTVDMRASDGDVFGCPIIGLALELGQEMPAIRKQAETIFNRIEAYMRLIASDAIAAGTAKDWDEASLGRTLVQLLHGAFASSRLASDPGRILDAANASLALLGSSRKLSA
ncbi:TetR/AcrR family transcriptional regulator [Altererythrobacter sp. ZODW24]|uniref:TetR/AcrR family transcriptional regulator n=1 Tax=Altererythrobacter sp. ZODW24 TaxID=2185142 RepID=UPI000DF84FF1|nr:TetR/AcrR family transcriptional regulator [Altererythrobacter sp. ZODW24]